MSYPNLTHVYDDNGRHRIVHDHDDIAITIGPRTDPWYSYQSPATIIYNGVQYIAFTAHHYPYADETKKISGGYRGPYADVIYVLTEKE